MAQMRTPLGKVRGLGSARDGTGHFWRIRVSSVALLPLSLYVVGLMVSLSSATHAQVLLALANPFTAVMVGLFLLASLDHMRLGMQVIIEDYVHSELPKLALLILNLFFTALVGAASLFARLKIAFGG